MRRIEALLTSRGVFEYYENLEEITLNTAKSLKTS